MFDFPFTDPNIITALYCLFFYLFLYKKFYKKIRYNNISKTEECYISILIVFFIITHCLRGDFFHFMQYIHDYIFIEGYYNYGEHIYVSIAQFTNKNYFLFRSLVFGGAFYIVILTAKRFGIKTHIAVLFLFLTFSITFAYARVTLAMALYFFGLSFISKPIYKYNFFSYTIGILIIALSTIFHNSVIIMILASFCIIIPIKKWIIITCFLSLPIISLIIKKYLFILVNSNTFNQEISDKIYNYSESEVTEGIASFILSFLQYLSFFIPLIILCHTLLKYKKNEISKLSITAFSKVTIGLSMLSITFYFLGESFTVFFYRILFMTMIPLSLCISKLYCEKMISYNQFKICLNIGITFNTIRYLYDVYVIFLNQ